MRKRKKKNKRKIIKSQARELDNLIRDVRAYHQRRIMRKKAEDKQLSDLRLESMVHYVIDKNPIHVKANDIRQNRYCYQLGKKT